MSREMLNRIIEAKKYEMMAIKALLPENERKHVDVIEKEIKSIFAEMVMDFMKEQPFNFSNLFGNEENATDNEENYTQFNSDRYMNKEKSKTSNNKDKVRKINIG